MDAILGSMREDELDLLREVERDRMAELGEDALLDLHTRVRRARSKYVKLYRRAASARVGELGGRGMARPKNRRNADKAEVFEDALARVSKQVEVVARRAAAALKAERLASARATASVPEQRRAPGASTGVAARAPEHAQTTGGLKRDASSRAQGARRQAVRDSR